MAGGEVQDRSQVAFVRAALGFGVEDAHGRSFGLFFDDCVRSVGSESPLDNVEQDLRAADEVRFVGVLARVMADAAAAGDENHGGGCHARPGEGMGGLPCRGQVTKVVLGVNHQKLYGVGHHVFLEGVQSV